MTRQEKNILTTLVLANVFLFCCLAPNLILFFDLGDSQNQIRSLLTAIIPTSQATSAPQATAAPTRPLPTATVEAGWKLYPMSKDQFAVALPSTWVSQELDAATIQSIIQTLQQKNPQFARVLGAQAPQLIGAGVKFFAVDFAPNSSVGSSLTTANVIHTTQSQVFTLDYTVGQSIKQLEDSGTASKPIEHQRVQLPVGEAEEVHYTLTLNVGSNQTLKTATTQYLLVHGKETYILTFSTAPTLDAKYRPTFDKIARTFRWED